MSSKPVAARHSTDASRATNPAFRSAIVSAARKLLAESTKDDRIGDCWLCRRTPSQDTPQIQITLAETATMTMQCAHLVLLGAGRDPTHWYEQASHRCGNRYCINPDHLLWELPWDNISRDGCHKYQHFARCPHTPSCLPEPDFAAVRDILTEARDTPDPLVAAFRREICELQQKRKAQGLDPGFHSKSSEYNKLYWKMVKSAKKSKTNES